MGFFSPPVQSQHDLLNVARIAEVGYTAVIDRLTPELTINDVNRNVQRSVSNAGGALAASTSLEALGVPEADAESVVVFDERLQHETIGTAQAFSFVVPVRDSDSSAWTAASATAVLGLPSPRLKKDAQVLAHAFEAALESMRPGARSTQVVRLYREGLKRAGLSIPTRTLGVSLSPEPRPHLSEDAPSSHTLDDGEAFLVLARVHTAEGPVAYGSTVTVSTDGAERTDSIPFRLIELR